MTCWATLIHHQVGVLGLLTHRTDGIAGESDAIGGQQIDRLDGHQLGAGLSPQLDKQREDERRFRLFGQGGEVGKAAWAETPCEARAALKAVAGRAPYESAHNWIWAPG